MAVLYDRYVRRIHKDHRENGSPRLMTEEEQAHRREDEYQDIFISVVGLGDGYAYWFPYTEGMTKVEMEAAIATFQGDEIGEDGHHEWIGVTSLAEGVAVITSELHQILTSSEYHPGSDSAGDASRSTLVGIAFSQAIKLVKLREPEIDWWD